MNRVTVSVLVLVLCCAVTVRGFDDLAAFRRLEKYQKTSGRLLKHCENADCLYENVADIVFKAMAKLPENTVESIYTTVLTESPSLPKHINEARLKTLESKLGKEIGLLNEVLQTYLNTNMTQYSQEFHVSESSFEAITGTILRQARKAAGVGDADADDFWGSVNTLRSYKAHLIRDSIKGYANKTIRSLPRPGERVEYCKELEDNLRDVGESTGFRELLRLFQQVCHEVIVQNDQKAPELMSRKKRAVLRGYTTARSQCGNIYNLRVSSQVRDTLATLRVVGGKRIVPGEYKFLASLVWRGQVICTATIIDARHALTAAHCTEGTVASELAVAVAEYDIAVKDGEVRIQVSKLFQHKQYNTRTIVNDISVLRLSRSVAGIKNAEPICLPRSAHCTKLDRRKCFVAGWGAKQKIKGGLVYPRIPRDGVVSAYLGGNCPLFPKTSDSNTQICSTGPSICSGDSGGPLFCQWGTKWTQCGVTSFGAASCNPANTNGVYTAVVKYRAWIKSIINT